MTPEEWGPPLWYKMHMITFNYNPKKDNKKDVIEYFENIKNVLPCENCKRHYENYMIARPLKYYLETRDDLVHWLIDLHNEVNSRTGKQILSYKEVRAIYESPYPSKTHTIIILLILITTFILLKNK
jgi:hypothetical protein